MPIFNPGASGGAVASVNGQTGTISLTIPVVLIYTSGAYPARPAGLPAGYAKYIGPVQPTDWLTNDEWVNNS